MENFKQTKIYEFCNKNKLWMIPLTVILCIVLIIAVSVIYKYNYIKDEFAYVAQAQTMEDYATALTHIDNILLKDKSNERALSLKKELTELYKKQSVSNNINQAKKYKDDGKYKNAYEFIEEALEIEPENEEALKLKNEILPLYEEEKARTEAESKARSEAKNSEKQKDIKTLVDTYEFDGELAVKILKIDQSLDSNIYSKGIFAYSQRSNDAKGYYYTVAYKYSDDALYWRLYKVYDNGTVENLYKSTEELSGYTTATNAENIKKGTAENKTVEVAKSNIQSYVSSWGYSVEYPSTYTIESLSNEIDFVITDSVSNANVNILTSYIDPDEDVENWTQREFMDSMAEQGFNISVTSFTHTTINGIKTIKAEYMFLGNSVTQIFYLTNDYNYIATYTKTPNTSSAVDAEMRRVITSLRKN